MDKKLTLSKVISVDGYGFSCMKHKIEEKQEILEALGADLLLRMLYSDEADYNLRLKSVKKRLMDRKYYVKVGDLYITNADNACVRLVNSKCDARSYSNREEAEKKINELYSRFRVEALLEVHNEH